MTNLLDDGPLQRLRGTIADEIDAIVNDPTPVATIYSEWQAPTGPAIILDGGGWKQGTGCGMTYTLRVNCVVGNQSGVALAHVEELTRLTYDALRQRGYSVQPVPPPGTIKFGDRDYPASQIKCDITLEIE